MLIHKKHIFLSILITVICFNAFSQNSNWTQYQPGSISKYYLNDCDSDYENWDADTFIYCNHPFLVKKHNSGMPSSYIRSITTDEDENIWAIFGANYNKFGKYNNSSWEIFSLPDSLANSGSIKYYDNNIWMRNSHHGIIIFNGSSFSILNSSNSELTTDKIYALEKGEDGDMWIGTDSGLFNYNGSSFTHHYDTTNSAFCKGSPKMLNTVHSSLSTLSIHV